MTWFFKHVFVGFFITYVFGDSGKCGTKLLNDYVKVPDSAFRATSFFIHSDSTKKKTDFSAKAARESYDKENQEFAWCPLNQVETSLSEYLEIDLGRLTMVKVVQTKGRFAQGAGKEFTPFYKIRYSRDLGQRWRDYKKFKDKGFQEILNGPNDAFLDAFETLDPPIIARWVRILPYSTTSKRVCLKLQLFGCDFENNLLEYNMLQGTPALISNGILLYQPIKSKKSAYPCLDNGYDGHYYEGSLQNGLGLLVDNTTGEELTNKTKELFYYVGWHREFFEQMKEYISIKFVFVNSRNFSSVRIHSYSNQSLQIDFFSRIDISFSNDDESYGSRIVKNDLLQKFAKIHFSTEIDLRGNNGRFLKMNLYFHSQWVLLSEISFRTDPSNTDYSGMEKPGFRRVGSKNESRSSATVTMKPKQVDYKVVTTSSMNNSDKTGSLEIIYLLAILLCLLLGVITAICSFWIIIKRKRYQRKKIIKKQALALCSQSSFIPYNHHSNSLQCLASSLPPVTIASRGNYPSYTVDRRNYPNGTLRTVTNLTGAYHSNNSMFDHVGITNKYCNGDTNIYTSIVGSDNDSSLSPEYATTSVTNDQVLPQTYSESPAYLPPPIEPIRSNVYCDSYRSSSDRKSLYYPHPNTLPSPQDSMSIWRINGFNNADLDRPYNSPNQVSFNDFSYLKYNHSNPPDNYGSNNSSKYTELPCINSHF